MTEYWGDIYDILNAAPTISETDGIQLETFFFLSLISPQAPSLIEFQNPDSKIPIRFRVWTSDGPLGYDVLEKLIEVYRFQCAYTTPIGDEPYYTSSPQGIFRIERASEEDVLSVGAFWVNGCYVLVQTPDNILKLMLAVSEQTCTIFEYPPSDVK